jgi:3-oxoacyl-[acyl-carrier protein] reductase
MRLKNKIALITGSSSGIGAAIAKGFSSEGATCIVTYKTNEAGGRRVAEDIGADLCVQLDVGNRQSVRAVFTEIKKRYGKLNILVNNAGVNKTADFDKQTDEEWDEVLNINLSGPFRCIQESLTVIEDGGKIINIGSLSGEYGGPRTPSYACAKMGLTALTHNAARFLGDRNICVNTLSPGVVGNEFTDKTMHPKVKEKALDLMLIKRFAKVEEMVGGAIFLASSDSDYMTAQTLSINGGAWVRA